MFGRRARLFFRLVLGQQIPQQSPDRRIVNGRGGAHEAERRSGALFTETEGVEPSSGGRRGNAQMNSLNSDAVKPAASSNSGPARAPISSEALYGGPTATKKSRGSSGSGSSASARSPKRTYWGSPVRTARVAIPTANTFKPPATLRVSWSPIIFRSSTETAARPEIRSENLTSRSAGISSFTYARVRLPERSGSRAESVAPIVELTGF